MSETLNVELATKRMHLEPEARLHGGEVVSNANCTGVSGVLKEGRNGRNEEEKEGMPHQ